MTAVQPAPRGTDWLSGTTLTPGAWRRLLDALDAGTPPYAACLYAGISPSVRERERQRIPEFGEAADKVERSGLVAAWRFLQLTAASEWRCALEYIKLHGATHGRDGCGSTSRTATTLTRTSPYQILLAGPLLTTPSKYRQAEQVVYAPAARDRLMAEAEQGLAGLQGQTQILTNASKGVPVALLVVPVSYQIESYDGDHATVSVPTPAPSTAMAPAAAVSGRGRGLWCRRGRRLRERDWR